MPVNFQRDQKDSSRRIPKRNRIGARKGGLCHDKRSHCSPGLYNLSGEYDYELFVFRASSCYHNIS